MFFICHQRQWFPKANSMHLLVYHFVLFFSSCVGCPTLPHRLLNSYAFPIIIMGTLLLSVEKLLYLESSRHSWPSKILEDFVSESSPCRGSCNDRASCSVCWGLMGLTSNPPWFRDWSVMCNVTLWLVWSTRFQRCWETIIDPVFCCFFVLKHRIFSVLNTCQIILHLSFM